MIEEVITVGRRLQRLSLYGDTASARFFLASVALLWAVALALPGNTFDRPVYRIMGEIAGGVLVVDTRNSTGGLLSDSGPAVYPTSTNLSVWYYVMPSPIPGTPTLAELYLAGSSDGNPDDSLNPYASCSGVLLAPLVTYWIRVDTWGCGSSAGTMYADGITYRIRVSLRYFSADDLSEGMT